MSGVAVIWYSMASFSVYLGSVIAASIGSGPLRLMFIFDFPIISTRFYAKPCHKLIQ